MAREKSYLYKLYRLDDMFVYRGSVRASSKSEAKALAIEDHVRKGHPTHHVHRPSQPGIGTVTVY